MNIRTRERQKVHIEVIIHRPQDEGKNMARIIKNALRKAKRKDEISYQIIDVPNALTR